MKPIHSPVFLDTNILFYLLDSQSQFHPAALNIFNTAKGNLVTSSKNLSEYLAATTKGEVPLLSMPNALADVSILQQNIHTLYPTQQSFTLFQTLLKKYTPKGNRVHDLEIAAIALTAGASNFVTANVGDFKKIKELNLQALTA